MAIPKIMVEAVKEFFPYLNVNQGIDRAREKAEKDPEACVLAVLLTIQRNLNPKEPWSTLRNNLQGATGLVAEARELLEKEKASE